MGTLLIHRIGDIDAGHPPPCFERSSSYEGC